MDMDGNHVPGMKDRLVFLGMAVLSILLPSVASPLTISTKYSYDLIELSVPGISEPRGRITVTLLHSGDTRIVNEVNRRLVPALNALCAGYRARLTLDLKRVSGLIAERAPTQAPDESRIGELLMRLNRTCEGYRGEILRDVHSQVRLVSEKIAGDYRALLESENARDGVVVGEIETDLEFVRDDAIAPAVGDGVLPALDGVIAECVASQQDELLRFQGLMPVIEAYDAAFASVQRSLERAAAGSGSGAPRLDRSAIEADLLRFSAAVDSLSAETQRIMRDSLRVERGVRELLRYRIDARIDEYALHDLAADCSRMKKIVVRWDEIVAAQVRALSAVRGRIEAARDAKPAETGVRRRPGPDGIDAYYAADNLKALRDGAMKLCGRSLLQYQRVKKRDALSGLAGASKKKAAGEKDIDWSRVRVRKKE